MSVSTYSVRDTVRNFLFNGDLDTKLLVTNDFLTPTVCLLYFVGVSYIGPYFMKNRPPFRLENTIILYNFALVAFNFHIAYGITHATFSDELFPAAFSCPSHQKRISTKKLALKVLEPYPWYFFLLKFVELLDSVFFVLRKKFNLLTVLHRFHHALTPLVSWYIINRDLNVCLLFGTVLNSVVHVVMYLYYGLAACGPGMKKVLWWKKYLTYLQIIQIISIILCVLTNGVTGCYAINTEEILLLCLCTLVLILFVNYFVRQYNDSQKKFVPQFCSPR